MEDTPDIKKQFENTLKDVVGAGNELLNKNKTFHENVEKELQEIDGKLDKLKQKFATVLSDIGHLNHEKRENNNKIVQLNETINKLTEQNNTQKVAMDAAIQKHNTEINALKAELTNVQAANDELKKSGDASKVEKEEIEAKRLENEKRIQGLEGNLKEKISENEDLKTNNIDTIAKYDLQIKNLQQQNENIDGLLESAIEELKKIMEIINGLSKGKKYEKIDTIKGKINELLGLVSTDVKFKDIYNKDNKDNSESALATGHQSIVSEMTKIYKGDSTPQPGERAQETFTTTKQSSEEEIKFDDMKKIKQSSFEKGEKILFPKNGIQKKGTVQNITLDPTDNKERNYSVIDENENRISGLTENQLTKVPQGGKKKTRKNKTAKRKKRVTKKKRGSNKKAKKFTQRKKR